MNTHDWIYQEIYKGVITGGKSEYIAKRAACDFLTGYKQGQKGFIGNVGKCINKFISRIIK